jgi:hypothetical protein
MILHDIISGQLPDGAKESEAGQDHSEEVATKLTLGKFTGHARYQIHGVGHFLRVPG